MKNTKILTKLMVVYCFIFTTHQIKIELPGHKEFVESMVQFIIDRKMTNLFHTFGSRAVVLDGTDRARDLFEMMSTKIPVSTIVTTINDPYMDNSFVPAIAYLFLEDENKIKNAIEHVQYSKLHHPTIPTVMIKLTKVKDDKRFDVVSIMKSAWDMGLHRFLLIYSDGDFKALSYNLFTSSIINVTNKTDSGLFPEYSKNMHRYAWKVSLFEEWPLLRNKRNTLNPSHGWVGRDITLLKIVSKLMNASFKVVEPPLNSAYAGAMKDILDRKVDFCFVRRLFYERNNENFEFINTGSLASLNVIIPKPTNNKKITQALRVFRKEIWFLLLFATMISLLITTRFLPMKQTKKYGGCNVCLDIWKILLNIPLQPTAKYNYNSTIPLVIWIWASLVLTASFQSRLIGLMSYPEYDKGIETLKDLEDANLPVYSSHDYVKMQGKEGYLRHQIHLVTHKEVLEKLDDPTSDCAVAIPFVYTRANINFEFQKYLESRQKIVLSESLVRSYAVYTFPQFSPFISSIYTAILEQIEYGLTEKLSTRKQIGTKFERETESTFRLNVTHVLTAITLMFFGCLASLTAFVIEILHGRAENSS